VEFLEAKQKNKPKGHKHPSSSKNESSGTLPSGTGATVTSHPNISGDSKEPSTINLHTETPVTLPPSSSITTTPNPPATVWPAIDSSSVKTPPPPNHNQPKKTKT